MASFARHVDVEWNGTLMEGNGTAKAGTGAFTLPVTFPSRINERETARPRRKSCSPASHAICYAMVLTNTIGKQGGKARRVRVTATVTADKSDAGIKVVSSNLKAVVEGLEGHRSRGPQRAGEERRERLPDLERDPRHRIDLGRRLGRLNANAQGSGSMPGPDAGIAFVGHRASGFVHWAWRCLARSAVAV